MRKAERAAWIAAYTLVLWLSLGPLLGLIGIGRYWPGFFYAPFYTTNLLTDPTTPAWQAGLRPSQRVVTANRERIDHLSPLTFQEGAANGTLSMVWEFAREAGTIQLKVEPLGWERIFEKWGPLLVTGLLLGWLGWRGYRWAGLAGLALLAAIDYLLNPGSGRETGFDPAGWLALGRWEIATAKWSTYFYWPFWTLVWAALGWYLIGYLFHNRPKNIARAIIGAVAASELGAYGYEAAKTATFNNPNYMIYHVRDVFWPGWGALLLLALAFTWQRRRNWTAWVALAGLLLFLLGWAVPTTFDMAWPGPGPQWYAWGLGLFAFAGRFQPPAPTK